MLIKGAGLSQKPLNRNYSFWRFLNGGGEGDLVKIHIHTEQPGAVLTACQGRGTLHDIKIDNMQDQHRHRVDGIEVSEGGSAGEEVAIGTLAVSSGAGLDEIFSSIGATAVIPGGQSMNTSANDFLQAIKRFPPKNNYSAQQQEYFVSGPTGCNLDARPGVR